MSLLHGPHRHGGSLVASDIATTCLQMDCFTSRKWAGSREWCCPKRWRNVRSKGKESGRIPWRCNHSRNLASERSLLNRLLSEGEMLANQQEKKHHLHEYPLIRCNGRKNQANTNTNVESKLYPVANLIAAEETRVIVRAGTRIQKPCGRVNYSRGYQEGRKSKRPVGNKMPTKGRRGKPWPQRETTGISSRHLTIIQYIINNKIQ